jgi:competence protein ComEA
MAADRRGQVDDATVARLRLEALGLPVAPPGWVPALPPAAATVTEEAVAVSLPTAGPEPPAGVPPTIDGLARAWVQDRVPPWAHGLVEQLRVRVVLGVLIVLAALVVGVLVLAHRGSSGGYSSSYDDSVTGVSSRASAEPSDPVASSPAAAASIVVDVGGRVRKPGLVTLPSGSRVADALAAAGGPLRPKQVATLNLAARVSDGELLLIGVKGAAGSTDGAADSVDGSSDGPAGGSSPPVSLSTATIEELETLPGVGPATAQKIIDWRTANNGFTSVSQLQQVAGIGPVKYGELSPLVTP